MRICVFVLLLSMGAASAKDEVVYPKGDSSQVFDGVPFQLRIPKKLDPAKPLGLVVILPGSLSDLDSLQDKPYVIVAPELPPGRASGLWSAGEVKVILRMVAHLRKKLSIHPAGMHAVAVGKTSVHDIFEALVFKKKSPFASVTYVQSSLLRTSIPSSARKKMAVLAYDWTPGPQDGGGVRDFLERFKGKVRVAELRQSSTPLQEDYYAYWLHVTGGGFVPGHDLSLPWVEPAKSMEAIRSVLKTQGAGGLLYFFSTKDDASTKGARSLQNDVFFDATVRAAARGVVCFKQARENHAELFSAFGLKKTPAVVVLDAKGEVISTFEGSIKAKRLRKALKKAAP